MYYMNICKDIIRLIASRWKIRTWVHPDSHNNNTHIVSRVMHKE